MQSPVFLHKLRLSFIIPLIHHFFNKEDSSLLTFLVPLSACTYCISYTWEWSPPN